MLILTRRINENHQYRQQTFQVKIISVKGGQVRNRRNSTKKRDSA